MQLESAASRVSNAPELLRLIFEYFRPVSQVHQGVAHKEERELQGPSSDCHTLYMAARVCRRWNAQAEIYLWRDISTSELEIFIDGRRPVMWKTGGCDHAVCDQRWERFNKDLGPHVRKFYLSSGNNLLFADSLEKIGHLNMPYLQHLQLKLSHPEETWMAMKLLNSPRLRSLDCTVLPLGLEVPSYHSNYLVTFFEQAADKFAARKELTDIQLVVADPNLWQVLRPAVVTFLTSFPSLENLKCSIEMLTPDFLETLSNLRRLYNIKTVGTLRPHGANWDLPAMPGLFAHGRGDFGSLTRLAICGSLPAVSEFLKGYSSTMRMTELDISVTASPSRSEFTSFWKYAVGLQCFDLKVFRLWFTGTAGIIPDFVIDKDVLEELTCLSELEDLEIIRGPVVSLTDGDVQEISTHWPKLRRLTLIPHKHSGTAFVPTLASLLRFAECRPPLICLNLAFSPDFPRFIDRASIHTLDQRLTAVNQPHMDTWMDTDEIVPSSQPQEEELWGSQEEPQFEGWGDSQDEDAEAWTVDTQRNTPALTPMTPVAELDRAINTLLPHAPEFQYAIASGAEDVSVVRKNGEKLRILGLKAYARMHDGMLQSQLLRLPSKVEMQLAHDDSTDTQELEDFEDSTGAQEDFEDY